VLRLNPRLRAGATTLPLAEAAAVFYSVVRTAIDNGADPERIKRQTKEDIRVLARLKAIPKAQLGELELDMEGW